MPKPIPTDVEFYVKKTKDRASQQGATLQKIEKLREDETDETMHEIERIKLRKMLNDIKSGYTESSNSSLIARILAGKSPEEINDYLENLSPNAVANLLQLAKATAENPMPQVITQSPQRSETAQMIEMLKLWKEMQPSQQQQQITPEIIREIIKAVQSAQPAVAQSQGNPMASTVEAFKALQGLTAPLRDELSKSNKEVFDLKMKEIEARMPQDPIEQIKYIKEMAGALGLKSSGTSEIDLKLEEMKENRDLDNRRLEWEQKKFEMEQEGDTEKWKQLANIFQGPIGEGLKNLGSAGADRVRGRRTAAGVVPQPVKTQCPQCQSVIFVDKDADTAVCGSCGAILQKQGSVQPPVAQPEPAPAPAPTPTHVDARIDVPKPEQAPPAEGEEEEEEENEPDEAKN